MSRESVFQRRLIDRIQNILPGCFIMRNPPDEVQGIPDLLILWGPYWAMLEVKRSINEEHQPNQDYYVNQFNEMSFASFISPETEEQVLNDLQLTFGVVR